jgi:hypothetical protein
MRKLLVLAIGAVTAVAIAACDPGSDPDGDGAEIVDQPTTGSPTPGGGEGETGDGTRENPLAPGVAFEVGDWTVELGPTNTDAADEIADALEFTEDPPAGRQYVMVELGVTYTGTESGDPFIELGWSFYGNGGNTYSLAEDDQCGLLPDDLVEVGEMFPDASASGNVCVAVPADEIEGGAWILEDFLAVDDADRTFVALQ